MKNNETEDLSTTIMSEIDKRHIVMRPKIYFIIASILLIAGVILLALTAAFFLNIAAYRYVSAAPFDFLIFGKRGIIPFMTLFPWLPLLTGIITTIGGMALLKRFDISYKKSILAVLSVFTLIILVGSVMINVSGINKPLQCRMRTIYTNQSSGYTWVDGAITDIGFFSLWVDTGDTVEKVEWHTTTEFPHGNEFEVGMRIRVVGERADGVFQALGIAIKGSGRGGSRLTQPGSGRGGCVQER